MTAAGAPGASWSDLVNGLLDARTDHATARFDAELAAAVAAEELSPRAANRLRFWQRAAVNAVDDHARTVLPAVLDALDASDAEARRYAGGAAATLGEAGPTEAGPTGAGPTGAGPTETGPTEAGPTGTAGRPAPAPVPPATPERSGPGWPQTTAERVVRLPAERADLDADRRASAPAGTGPSTLGRPSPRLFVADLREIPASDRA